jgi:ribosomal-protein-serine acetyltransferase
MGNIGVYEIDWENECCKIGYWILGRFEGNGYVRESVVCLERVLFDMGFNRVVIMCEEENQRSRKIPLSLGYTLEGTLREYVKRDDRFMSHEVHSKLKREYLQAAGQQGAQ